MTGGCTANSNHGAAAVNLETVETVFTTHNAVIILQLDFFESLRKHIMCHNHMRLLRNAELLASDFG